ncbi:acyl-CoA dehydrogenase family protein [Alicycliphilus denitrificans]|uniref:Acyl-[acyl-carrier-protein] dehydrogenase MbtN n=1 Tax=Alicycliphilus denitrificans TaxID=179636 RepID=A0A3R7IV31_9BURK|nr:acyl-CoA dehydrogenase family protein [Alicycliphilus denitrificans]RKJ99190.1 acyl-CoA dehydrogenase [Alicycliphilus denitrificans]
MRTIFSEEHEQFREQVRRFCEKEVVPHIRQWERDGVTPKSFWRMAGGNGILCTTIPEQYGGPGGDFLHACVVTEELARIGLSTGIPVHSDMVSPYLLHYGSEELKQRFLPRLCRGEIIGSIGMTEPGTGSDLKNIKTTAVRDGDEWVINGQKTWITNGINCGVVLLACKTDPAAGARGVSLIAVEADAPGFTKSARPLEKIGLHAQDTAELFFDNVRVPASNLLGEQNKGFIYLMEQLPQERLVIALRSAMVLETQLEASVRYTGERKVFGNSILSFQNSKFKLAEAKAYCGMLRVYIDDLVRQHVQQRISVEQAACAKLVATELMGKYLDELLQLHGGYGYSAEYGIGRAWVDARVARIAGGASEVLKDIISRQWHGLL